MNPYLNHWQSSTGYKDKVFAFATNLLDPIYPLNILEIGTARNLSKHCRVTDGWSAMYWAEFLASTHPRVSNLVLYDIDDEALNTASCLLQLGSFPYVYKNYVKVDLRLGQKRGAFDLIVTKKWDLIYLDGSDDPRETKDQFEWAVDQEDVVIVIDDYNTKGSLIQETKYPHQQFVTPFSFDGYSGVHVMAVFHRSLEKQAKLELGS